MILPIYAFGCSVLRQKTEEITKSFPNLEDFISSLYHTSDNAYGVGLAAPQVGKNLRIFIVDTTKLDQKHDEYEDIKDFKEVFINPKIVSTSGDEVTYNEGCLSFPDIFYDITRQDEVEIEYLDEKFNLNKKKFRGFLSRVIQHEYDHLEGILFIDKMPLKKRKELSSKLDKIYKGKVITNYQMKFKN